MEAINAQFKVPLPVSEVKAIAKSISNWTCREFTPNKFRQSQARKGAKGGKAGSREDKAKAGALSKRKPLQGSEAHSKPWEKLEISRRTYYNRKKSGDL